MTEQEMKLLHERMKKEDPKLLVLMEKCFDAGVLSGKEQAQRKPWVGLTQQEQASVLASVPTVPFEGDWHLALLTAIEAKLREKNK